MVAASVSNAANRRRRAVEQIVDPYPTSTQPIWTHFDSRCAYCDVELSQAKRDGQIDHATPGLGNHLGNLVLACGTCNGDEKLDMEWAEFLDKKERDPVRFAERKARIDAWIAAHPIPVHAVGRVGAVGESLQRLDSLIAEFRQECGRLRDAVRSQRDR